MEIRVLEPSDEAKVETFLRAHRDSSMFLRSNIRKVGLLYREKPFHALYVALFRHDEVVGVVAHSWNGMLLVQAPEAIEDLARTCVQCSGRRVAGFVGPLGQVRRARAALNLDAACAASEEDESLFALNLADLVMPPLLATGAVSCRPPLAEERGVLLAWRVAYQVEALGATESAEGQRLAGNLLDAQIANHNAWVAVDQGRPVSLSAFNAALPDIVQLGGIYTPPALRGRGYAKVAVAASLVIAAERGASRAVLFVCSA